MPYRNAAVDNYQYFTNCTVIRSSSILTIDNERLLINNPSQDLDRSNINNAYVSGMKEELHMLGNQFNVRDLADNLPSWST